MVRLSNTRSTNSVREVTMNEGIPEYYGDAYYIRTNPWGVAITFAVAPPTDDVDGHNVCIVRLSHETAKAISMIIRRQLKNYESDTGTPIAIRSEVMKALDLSHGDW